MGQMSMHIGIRSASLFACSVFLFGVDPPEARAGGAFAISTQGAYALGTAFAGVASGSAGLPSIYWNPATITRFEGRNVSAGATLVFPYADITPQPGTDPLLLPLGGTGDIAEDAVIPTFNLGWQAQRSGVARSVSQRALRARHACPGHDREPALRAEVRGRVLQPQPQRRLQGQRMAVRRRRGAASLLRCEADRRRTRRSGIRPATRSPPTATGSAIRSASRSRRQRAPRSA